MRLFCCSSSSSIHVYDPAKLEEPPEPTPTTHSKSTSSYSLRSWFSSKNATSVAVTAETTKVETLTDQVAKEVLYKKEGTDTPETFSNTSREDTPLFVEGEEEAEEPLSRAVEMLRSEDQFDSIYSPTQINTMRAWNSVYAADEFSRTGGSKQDSKEILGSLLSHKSYYEGQREERDESELEYYYGGSPSLQQHIDESINKVVYPSYSGSSRKSVLPDIY